MPASRNWDGSAKQRMLYSFCCSLQHVCAQIDVMPLPESQLQFEEEDSNVVASDVRRANNVVAI
jgi:hypothetical protein